MKNFFVPFCGNRRISRRSRREGWSPALVIPCFGGNTKGPIAKNRNGSLQKMGYISPRIQSTLGSWARLLAMSSSVGTTFFISPLWNFS